MTGNRNIPQLQSPVQLMQWAQELVRVLRQGDNVVEGGVVTVPQFTADVNNLKLPVGLLYRLSSDASRTITGIGSGTPGRLLVFSNRGTNPIVLANLSASSAIPNQIVTGTGANLTITAGMTVILIYDNVSMLWLVER